MTSRRTHPAVIVGGAVAGALTGLLDALWTWLLTPAPLHLADGLTLTFHFISLFPLIGILASLLLAAAGAGIRLVAPGLFPALGRGARRAWAAQDPDGGFAAATWTLGLFVPATVGGMILLAHRLIVKLNDQWLKAAAVVLAGLALQVAMYVAGFVCWKVLRALFRLASRWRIVRNVVSPRAALLVLSSAVIAAITVAIVRAGRFLLAVDLTWLVGLLVFLALLWCGVTIARRLGAGRRWAAGVSLVAVVLFGIVCVTFGRNQTVAHAAHNHTALGQWVIRGVSKASDWDRDGYGFVLGAGDCAPFDRTINPGALEIPDDGIDQNCNGHDLSAASLVKTWVRWADLPEDTPEYNILLVSVDALRMDRVGAYGYRARPTTPNVDLLASRSTLFTNAYTASSRSLKAIPALLSGRYPSELLWGTEYLFQGLLPQNVMLPELLQAAGFETRAFNSSGYFTQSPDFYQGFEQFDAHSAFKGSTRETVDQAIHWLKERSDERQFFAWVHLFDPHDPYYQREGFEFGTSLQERYDSEIAYTDHQFGRLMAALDASPQGKRTVIVFTADHGEAFGEHGKHFHGKDLHEELIRVPLLIHVPDIPPRTERSQVSLVDIAPTVLNLVGLRPQSGFSGRSLAGTLFRGELPDDLPVFAELLPDGEFPNHMTAIILPGWKLIRDVATNTYQLFDLQADPNEKHNLYDQRREISDLLKGQLHAWTDSKALAENRPEAVIAANVVKKVPELQLVSDAVLGGTVRVLGVVAEEEYHPGGWLPLTFYFKCLQKVDRDYRVEVLVEGPGGGPIKGFHTPVYGMYRTNDWVPGQIIRDELNLRIPEKHRPGDYKVLLTFRSDKVVLKPQPDAPLDKDRLLVGTIRIAKKAAGATMQDAPPLVP